MKFSSIEMVSDYMSKKMLQTKNMYLNIFQELILKPCILKPLNEAKMSEIEFGKSFQELALCLN